MELCGVYPLKGCGKNVNHSAAPNAPPCSFSRVDNKRDRWLAVKLLDRGAWSLCLPVPYCFQVHHLLNQAATAQSATTLGRRKVPCLPSPNHWSCGGGQSCALSKGEAVRVRVGGSDHLCPASIPYRISILAYSQLSLPGWVGVKACAAGVALSRTADLCLLLYCWFLRGVAPVTWLAAVNVWKFEAFPASISHSSSCIWTAP